MVLSKFTAFIKNNMVLEQEATLEEKHNVLRKTLKDYVLDLCKKRKKVTADSIHHIEDAIDNYIESELVSKKFFDLKEEELKNIGSDDFLKSFVHVGLKREFQDYENFIDGNYILTSFLGNRVIPKL